MRSLEKRVLIAQDITVVEATHPQVGGVNTPTMIMMNHQRNTVPRMSTANSATPPHHHGTIDIMAAALVDTALPATPQRILGPHVLPGHISKTHLLVPMAKALPLHRGEVAQIPVLPKEAPGTQETSPVTLRQAITTALGAGVRDSKTGQAPGGKTPLLQA